MKKILCVTALVGALNAANVDVMSPHLRTHCELRLLEQDLGPVCGNLPFNADFNWECLTKEMVTYSLERLNSPSLRDVLTLWKDSQNLGSLSTSIIILLNEETHNFNPKSKKKHMWEIITSLNLLWQKIPLY